MSAYPSLTPISPWPIFNSNQFTVGDSAVSRNYVDSTFLKLTGGTMLGTLNALTITSSITTATTSSSTGAVLLSGGLAISNATDATSITSGGTITTAGGIACAKTLYCAAQSIVNSTSQITLNSSSGTTGRATIAFTTDSSSWELGARNSANGTYNDSLYIYRAGYLLTMNTSGNTSFLSTTDAISSTSGGTLTISGGTAIAKKLYIGSHSYTSGSILQGNSTDTSRAISCLNSNLSVAGTSYITLGQAASNNNQAEICFYYAGSSSTSNKLQLGFYGTSRLVELAASGVMSINSGIASTTQSNGSLVITGGLGISGSINTGSSATFATAMNSATATIGSTSNTGGTLSITSVGYHLAMYYSSTVNSTINTSSGGNIVLTSTNGGTSTYYTFANNGQIQLSGISARNSHKLDLGTNTSQDNLICLAQTNNTSPSYMLGVSSSSLNYTSGSAHAWFSNTSSTPAITGSERMRLTEQGSLILSSSGYHAYGSDITGLSSINAQGLHLQVASNVGTILNYNYSASTYGDLNLNSTLFIKSSNSSVGIGTNSPTCPLHVNGTAGQTTASGFGYLNSGGAGSATGFTNRQFSILASGGICTQSGEIDVLSDIRLKQKISAIDTDLAERFVKDIEPIEYAYNANPEEMHYGYSAQELVKHGYNTIVGYTGVDEPLPEQTIECVNGDVLHLPSDTRLIVNMLNTIPLLHKALKNALSKINQLEEFNRLTHPDIEIEHGEGPYGLKSKNFTKYTIDYSTDDRIDADSFV